MPSHAGVQGKPPQPPPLTLLPTIHTPAPAHRGDGRLPPAHCGARTARLLPLLLPSPLLPPACPGDGRGSPAAPTDPAALQGALTWLLGRRRRRGGGAAAAPPAGLAWREAPRLPGPPTLRVARRARGAAACERAPGQFSLTLTRTGRCGLQAAGGGGAGDGRRVSRTSHSRQGRIGIAWGVCTQHPAHPASGTRTHEPRRPLLLQGTRTCDQPAIKLCVVDLGARGLCIICTSEADGAKAPAAPGAPTISAPHPLSARRTHNLRAAPTFPGQAASTCSPGPTATHWPASARRTRGRRPCAKLPPARPPHAPRPTQQSAVRCCHPSTCSPVPPPSTCVPPWLRRRRRPRHTCSARWHRRSHLLAPGSSL